MHLIWWLVNLVKWFTVLHDILLCCIGLIDYDNNYSKIMYYDNLNDRKECV